MPDRNRKTVADQNEALITAGSYTAPNGSTVVLSDDVREAREGTRLYEPTASARLVAEITGEPKRSGHVTTVEVTDESSMVAARRLVVEERRDRVAVLNFASARNPGGGYLGGARAQEEDLCRVSALYTTLLQAPDYYAAHRADRNPLYSHRVIFSPAVPVFRDQHYRLLDEPYAVSFLTSPAPNAGVVARDRAAEVERLLEILTERAARVLAVAAHHGVRTLVLGAWGCGVFRNDPDDVAAAFKAHLGAGGLFEDQFDRVVFAVLDRAPGRPNLAAFVKAFRDDR